MTEPISDTRLAEIREADTRWHDASPEPSQTSVFRHRAELLAEVDRLATRAAELEADHNKIWLVVARLREDAKRVGLDPYQHPIARDLSAILCRVPNAGLPDGVTGNGDETT